MRLYVLVLFALTLAIQYPLWWGKGGWARVQELQEQAAAQQEVNQALQARNAALQAEVLDLGSGTDALEERARGELGMVREGEIFVEFLPGSAGQGAVGQVNPAGVPPSSSTAQ